jgi:hypothetical protein
MKIINKGLDTPVTWRDVSKVFGGWNTIIASASVLILIYWNTNVFENVEEFCTKWFKKDKKDISEETESE